MPYSVSLTTRNTLNPNPQLGNFWATKLGEEKGGSADSGGQLILVTKLGGEEEKSKPAPGIQSVARVL